MPEITPSKYLVTAGWSDVPHLDERTKRELLDSTPPHLRAARSEGKPSLGAGAIYPVEEESVIVDDFMIPSYWKRGYGMDVGWNRTAAVFGALDPDNDILYVYGNHYRGQAEPAVHAAAVLARGKWIKGAIDPAAKGRSQKDGEALFDQYKRLGLNLYPAINGVEAGIYEVWTRLSTGRLKIFKSCTATLAEYRLYRRDEHGKIVKDFDHAMDAMRYLVATMKYVMQNMPVPDHFQEQEVPDVLDPYVGY